MKSVIKVISLLLLSFIIFTTCDNSVGLGPLVNTEKPVIKNAGDDNLPGSFLQGTKNPIKLDVENSLGFEIKTVEMEVEYRKKDGFLDKKTISAYKDEEGNWVVDLDVSEMMDGKISTWVTAIDESGNKTRSTEITYFVKNLLPQIKLNIPSVSEVNFDDLDYLNKIKVEDPIYQGLDIMGLATDDSGIYVVKDKDGNIIDEWPKIMFWPANLPAEKLNTDGTPIDNKDDNPYGQWRTVVMPANHSSSATKFSWPLAQMIRDPNAPDGTGWRLPKTSAEFKDLDVGKQYRFRLWIKDSFGNDNYYPDRTDNTRGPDGTPEDTTNYIKYIEVTYQAIGDKPFVTVPEPPRYYNRVGDFTVDLSISSGESFDYNDPTAVKAWITTKNDGLGTVLGEKYAVLQHKDIQRTPFIYKLTITQDEAALWGNVKDTLYVAIQGKNNQGETGPVDYQYFNLDEVPPTLVIDQPGILDNVYKSGTFKGGEYSILYPPGKSKPKWVTYTVTVGGKANDNYVVDKIYFHVGKLGDDKMTDEQRVELYNSDIWTNTGLGTAFMAPKWSGSVYAWNYIDTYPIGYKNDARYTDLVQELSELGFVPADDKDYATLGKERFYLPLYVKVVDIAGNVNVVHYKISIDPLLDEPQINIIYPPEKNEKGEITTVGGTVRVTGTAEDNYWMHTVLMRIHKDGVTGTGNAYYYKPTTDPETKFFFPSSYPLSATPSNTDGWFELKLVGDGPMVNWTASVNGDGGLNPEGNAETVDVTFEVVAIDTNEVTHQTPHIIGPIETRTVKFSSKVPRIENIEITKNKGTPAQDIREYFDGISTSGLFVISMKISATDGINKVLARVNNDSQITLMTGNNAINNSAVWNITKPELNDGRYEAILTMTVNSTAANSIVKDLGYGKTGVMNLEITVEDATANNFSTTNNFRVGIDNLYPSAKIETSAIASDDNAKKPFLVQGTAKDSGKGSVILQGLERVLVYFQKARITYTVGAPSWTGRKVEGIDDGTGMLRPDGSYSPSTDFIEYPVMDTAKAGWYEDMVIPNAQTGFVIPKLELKDYIDLSGKPAKAWASEAAMVIDNSTESDPLVDYDKDGTYGEKWIGLTDKIWEARMLISDPNPPHVQKFPDGPYIVHYIVMDTAGNATHYQKDIYIENNKPRIIDINIGTDINFDGEVDEWNGLSNPGEYRKNAFIIDKIPQDQGIIEVPDTEFRIRNKLFGIRLTWEKGNGSKRAQVTYVTKGSSIPASEMKRGHVYQIGPSNGASIDFTKFGAPNNYPDTVFVAAASPATPPQTEIEARVYPFNKFNDTSEQELPLSDSESISSVSNNYVNFDGITNNKTGLFIMKVYDTAIASTSQYPVHPEYDQLASAVLLTVSVNNTDTDPPKIEVANFGRKHTTSLTGNAENYDDNGLSRLENAVYADYIDTSVTTVGSTTVTTKNGYVQYQEHSTPDTTAYISGKVIFNGKVNDNHRIEKITVQIPVYNSGLEFDIAIRNTSNGLLQQASTSADWKFNTRNEYAGVSQYSLEYGHTLVWQFMWDSSKINTVATNAQNNVDITFRVYDQNTTVPSAITSIKKVNIVPYISEIVTPLSKAYASNPSAFNRSALGGYPVKEGDSITIKGFNLGKVVSNAVIIGTDDSPVALSGGSFTETSLTGTVPNSATSGPLVVTVNEIASFNNSSSKNKNVAYNNEPNNVNNNVLDNSRYIYVWNTGYIDDSTVANFYNPFMRVDTAGNRLLSYGWYPSSGNGRLRVNRNGTIIVTATANTNRMTNTTIATSSSGSWYAAGSDITAGNYPFKFARSDAAGTGYTGETNIVDAIGANSNRFKIPRIAVHSTNGTSARSDNNGDRILMSYYDDSSADKNINIIYGNVGATAVSNIPGTPIIVANNTTTFKSGMYTAVGFLSNGLPLIAWYDGVNENLVFSYGSGTPSSTYYNSAISRVTTETNNSTHYVYTLNNHGLYNGDIVLAGNTNNPTTKYYAHVFDNNTFSLSTTINGTGVQVSGTNNIYFTKHITVPTTTTRTNTLANNTWEWTFPTGHGLTNNRQVYIVYNDGTVSAVQYARGTNGNNNWKFASANNSTTANQFYGGTAADNNSPILNLLFMYLNNSGVQATYANTMTYTNTWQGNAVVIDTGKGAHVDMAVDGNDNVHLAYYDVNNGGLYYALIPPSGTDAAKRPNTTGITPVKVDTFLSAGTKIMINVRPSDGNYVPYITYAHASFAETKNSIRVAWRINSDFNNSKPSAGTDENDIFTGKWEVMTVPVSSTVVPRTDEFICNGVPTATTWTPPGNPPENQSTLTYNTNLHQSIIVGYMTDQWYEGAIIKGNIIAVPEILRK